MRAKQQQNQWPSPQDSIQFTDQCRKIHFLCYRLSAVLPAIFHFCILCASALYLRFCSISTLLCFIRLFSPYLYFCVFALYLPVFALSALLRFSARLRFFALLHFFLLFCTIYVLPALPYPACTFTARCRLKSVSSPAPGLR